MKNLKSALFFLCVLVLSIGCGSHEPFQIDEESSDAGVSPDGGRRDTSVSALSCEGKCGGYSASAQCQCDSECSRNGDCCGDYVSQCTNGNTCVDLDGDGYCNTAPKAGDCNDANANINPGKAEVCGDNVDNDCDGVADEGCGTTCVAVNEICNDGKDNDCDGNVDEGCSAQCTATTEVCDGIDNDCDGNVDEGCPQSTSNATLTVQYNDSATRRLSYGVTSEKSSIPYVWNPLSWATSSTLTADLGNIQTPTSGCLYVRFNVDEPNQHWFCEGQNATAHLNSAASVTLKIAGSVYSKPQTITLGGGCSGIFVINYSGANCTL